ncbi:MAG: ATP-dependent zinc metalloprotease FtsH [bacterium]
MTKDNNKQDNQGKDLSQKSKLGSKTPKSPKVPRKMPEVGGLILNNFFATFLIFIAIIAMYVLFYSTPEVIKEISLSELATDINDGKVSRVEVVGDKVNIEYLGVATSSTAIAEVIPVGTPATTSSTSIAAIASVLKKTTQKEAQSSLSDSLKNLGVDPLKLSQVKIENKDDRGAWFWAANIIPFALPIVFLIFIIWYISKQARGANMQAMSFGQTRARMISPDDTKAKVTFKDVAGAKEAKQELAEIVDFLKNPEKFIKIGARIPKGILLTGAPGTGKTLLARAVAGEAGVAFFSVSGAEFVEMFVGVGASRVRDLFKLAKASAPAIIFIDEIDAVGRVRGTGIGGGNDEREQTLNQILVEMDGFEPTEKVIMMAATNRPDVLDPALLRPGRFDRRVIIDLPDRKDREAILEVHTKNKPLAEDVNLDVIASRTSGLSGADLHSLVNEAAILAAREDRTKVGQYDLIRSIEKVLLGPERKSHLLGKKEKELTAYHEAGHALLASVLEHADPVHKVSIISRGRAAGYTMKLPLEDRKLQSKKEFLDDIVVSLGGYVVEKHIFDELTTGSSNDLQVASALARDMVTRYGMSDKIGPIALEGNGRAMSGRGVGEQEYSAQTAAVIDQEISKIMNDSYKIALDVITEKRNVLDAISVALIDKETLEQADFDAILVANGIMPKKKSEII